MSLKVLKPLIFQIMGDYFNGLPKLREGKIPEYESMDVYQTFIEETKI